MRSNQMYSCPEMHAVFAVFYAHNWEYAACTASSRSVCLRILISIIHPTWSHASPQHDAKLLHQQHDDNLVRNHCGPARCLPVHSSTWRVSLQGFLISVEVESWGFHIRVMHPSWTSLIRSNNANQLEDPERVLINPIPSPSLRFPLFHFLRSSHPLNVHSLTSFNAGGSRSWKRGPWRTL